MQEENSLKKLKVEVTGGKQINFILFFMEHPILHLLAEGVLFKKALSAQSFSILVVLVVTATVN